MKLIDRVEKSANEQSYLGLYLTVRTTTILHSHDIYTIEQLAQTDELDLLKMPGFGGRCLRECLDLVEFFLIEGKL
jgi:DNA-directed RNA polymerase alpha subunit